MQCPVNFFQKSAGEVYQHLPSLPAWCIQWCSREISSVQQRQSAWKGWGWEKLPFRYSMMLGKDFKLSQDQLEPSKVTFLLSTATAYSNTIFLNPRHDWILNRTRFLLQFCSIESYQINFISEKFNLIIGASGHTSSITLISLSTSVSARSCPSIPMKH